MTQATFRYATSEDNKFFFNQLLKEKIKTAHSLGIYGFDENNFMNGKFEASMVGELDGKVIGFFTVRAALTGGFNYLQLVYVLPEFRRKGYGKQILENAQKYCLNNWNAIGIDLYTIENENMDKMVKKSGFHLSGTTKKHYFINGKFYSQSRWLKLYKERNV